MKLVLSIVNNDDAAEVSAALTEGGFQVTRLATTGGFLKKGNTTFMTGTDDEKVDTVIDIISKKSSKRHQLLPSTLNLDMNLHSSLPYEVSIGGATIFVMDVESFIRI